MDQKNLVEHRYHWKTFSEETFTPDKELRDMALEYTEWRNVIWNGLMSKIKARVLVEDTRNVRKHYSKILEFEFPASPWQHFKERYSDSWWLRWFVARWPVRWETRRHEVSFFVNFNPLFLFPEQTKVPRDFGRVVRLVEQGEEEWRVYHQAADYHQIR